MRGIFEILQCGGGGSHLQASQLIVLLHLAWYVPSIAALALSRTNSFANNKLPEGRERDSTMERALSPP